MLPVAILKPKKQISKKRLRWNQIRITTTKTFVQINKKSGSKISWVVSGSLLDRIVTCNAFAYVCTAKLQMNSLLGAFARRSKRFRLEPVTWSGCLFIHVFGDNEHTRPATVYANTRQKFSLVITKHTLAVTWTCEHPTKFSSRYHDNKPLKCDFTPAPHTKIFIDGAKVSLTIFPSVHFFLEPPQSYFTHQHSKHIHTHTHTHTHVYTQLIVFNSFSSAIIEITVTI